MPARCLGTIGAGFAALTVALSGCGPATSGQPAPQDLAPLVLVAPGRDGASPAQLRQVDRTTLQPIEGATPLDLPACTEPELPRGSSSLAVAVLDSAPGSTGQCRGTGTVSLRFLDMARFQWGAEVRLDDGGGSVSMAWSPLVSEPLAVSPDGKRLYAVTIARAGRGTAADPAQPAVARLWIVDTSGRVAPTSVVLPYQPWRLDVAPDGTAVYVLGQNAAPGADPVRGPFLPTSGAPFLAVLDPSKGTEWSRVGLPTQKAGYVPTTQRPQGFRGFFGGSAVYTPGIGLAPDGTRYFAAHADESALDVVDTRALKLERLERTIRVEVPVPDPLAGSPAGTSPGSGVTLGSTSAWTLVSPDGSKLYTRRDGYQAGIVEVDTRTWAARPFDATAQRAAFSPDGTWMYLYDAPTADRGPSAARQRRDVREAAGARLRVLNAATGQTLGTLVQDKTVLQMVPRGTDRLYVVVPSQEPGAAVSDVDVLAYEVGTWRELGRTSEGGYTPLVGTSWPGL